jgi:hypothetical protein
MTDTMFPLWRLFALLLFVAWGTNRRLTRLEERLDRLDRAIIDRAATRGENP